VALKSDGTVACWGDDLLGQSTTPPGTTGVTAIAAGFVHTLALRGDGSIAGWGQNNYGQATPPAGATPATAIVAGAAHSVARRADGSIVCFGNNTFGQSTPPADLGAVERVFAGGYCTAAIRPDGTVRVWGRNDFGQASVPSTLTRADVVAMGVAHAVSLSTVSQLGDCDEDGLADACEIQGGAPDANANGVPDTCENLRPADLNGDGAGDGADLALLLGDWG
jgi:alpha-tubulin suppressor-like RCC1 family protein